MPEPLAGFALAASDKRLLLGLAWQLAFFDFLTRFSAAEACQVFRNTSNALHADEPASRAAHRSSVSPCYLKLSTSA